MLSVSGLAVHPDLNGLDHIAASAISYMLYTRSSAISMFQVPKIHDLNPKTINPETLRP